VERCDDGRVTRHRARLAPLAAAVLAATTLAPTAGPAVAGTPGQWTTYHLDNARTGLDTSEPSFSGLAPGFNVTVDGAVYAEPLVFNGTVFVATENDSIYGLDAASGAVKWRTNLGFPVPLSSLPCGDINPLGITGTPVIDTATGTIYAVAELNTIAGITHELVALSTVDGAVKWRRSADVNGMDPTPHQQRAALALANGRVYFTYGGLAGDCGQYIGKVVSSATDGSGPLSVWQVPTTREGGIWAPSGPAVDAAGNVYVSTGNGAQTATFDKGNSIIKLSPGLAELDYFATSTWAQDSANDLDLGSTGPALLLNNLAFVAGKTGMGYLLDATHLGGIGGQRFAAQVCNGGGAYGGFAYQPPRLFVPCSNGLRAITVDTTAGTFSAAWQTLTTFAGPPIVAGGVLWSVGRDNNLYGLDPATGGQISKFALPPVAHFTTPAAADGRLYVAGNDKVLSFNAPNSSSPPPAPPYNGYLLDGWGGVHNSGSVPPVRTSAYWPGWDIARDITVRADGKSGYVLDGWGGVHEFGGAPRVTASAYFPGWDIARAIALDPCDATGGSGYVLDGWGGLHPFGKTPLIQAAGYSPGHDVARDIVMNGCTNGKADGLILWGEGAIFGFGAYNGVTSSWRVLFPGFDIGRAIVAKPGTTAGYVLDGWGGVHEFGGAPRESSSAYAPGMDLWRGAVLRPDGVSGWSVDAWGGIHSFGAAPPASSPFYAPGFAIIRSLA
jgi:outer membrane protein assembly factor BamB